MQFYVFFVISLIVTAVHLLPIESRELAGGSPRSSCSGIS